MRRFFLHTADGALSLGCLFNVFFLTCGFDIGEISADEKFSRPSTSHANMTMRVAALIFGAARQTEQIPYPNKETFR
jgi:hypothetical protein